MSYQRPSRIPSLRRSAQPQRSPGHVTRSSANRRTFLLEIRLRGQIGFVQQTSCAGLEEALRFGQAHFPAFAERNPWMGQDWLRRKIWILLDPETESTR